VLEDDVRQALADQLLELPTPELVDVLHRVLPAHASTSNGQTTTLVLAEVTQTESLDHPDELLVQAVAWPDRDYYDGGFGPEPELWENGTCANCHIDLVSTAKRGTCPVCGAACSLT
jgi:hypothetical protein